ncbi:MAG: Fe-S cluster assembly protein SufD [Anaerolineales bacterium]|jgi:Fe-S cluster assembly protein SufD
MSSKTVSRAQRVVRKTKTPEFNFSAQDVGAVSEAIGEPESMAKARMHAWEQYQKFPMPTLKDEPWRRTDIRTLPADRVELKPVEDIPVDPSLLEPLLGDEHGSLLVLRPGYAPELRADASVGEQGVIFTDFATALREHSEALADYIGQIVRPEEGKFAALATAMAGDGVVLYVPEGVHVEQPMHSILWAPGAGEVFFSRVLIVVEKGASATFIHEAASPNEEEGEAVHNGIVEIHVGDGANLKFVELQNLGEHTWNFTHERAKVGQDANLDWIFGAVGSRLTKNFSDIDLLGDGATARMSGFYFADGHQHLDHDTQQNHMAPHTTSDLLYKGGLIGHGRSVWQGMIYVAPGAQQTDGYQANRNLVLSKTARADSIPGLEIMANDVRCTHGATIGQLEEEPIFYLMTRGITRAEAERLVIDGFFSPIMERIPFEGVRNRFEEMIDVKLGTQTT